MAPTSEQRKSASPTWGPPRDLAYMRAFGTDEWMDEVPPLLGESAYGDTLPLDRENDTSRRASGA